jgi:hypothetical protein
MNHPEAWYHKLAHDLGHDGYVTLAEVRQQEARDARQVADMARWHRSPVGLYWTVQDEARYTIIREHGKRTWEIEVWPLALSHPRYGRTQPGIRTLTEAKGLALAMPCARCGLASPLILMTRRMPARPSLAHLVTERWRCIDTQTCEAERGRITGQGDGPVIPLPVPDEVARQRLEVIRVSLRAENISWGELAELQSLAAHIEPGDTELLEPAGVPEFPEPAGLILHNPATSQSVPWTPDPANLAPDCPNSLADHLEDRP